MHYRFSMSSHSSIMYLSYGIQMLPYVTSHICILERKERSTKIMNRKTHMHTPRR